MAISMTHLTSDKSNSADPSTASISPTAGAHILLWCGASYASGSVPDSLTVSGGGATWTKIFTGAWRGRRRSWLYIGSGWSGSDTIDLTYSGTDPQQWAWIVDEATGLYSSEPYRALADFTLPVDAINHVHNDSAGIPVSGEVMYVACALETDENSLGVSGYTTLGDEDGGNLGVRLIRTQYKASTTDPNVEWTWGGSSEGVCAASIILCEADPSNRPTFVQSKHATNESSGSLTAVFDTAPTEGNLLIAMMCERNTEPTSDSMTTSGYTKVGYDRVTDDGTYRRGMAVYYKFAGSSESATVEGTFTPALASSTITIMEFSGVGSYVDNIWADNYETANATSLASGSQSTSAASVLITMTSYKAGTDYPGLAEGLYCTLTNDFAHCASHYLTSNSKFETNIGLGAKSSSGSYSTTETIVAPDGDTNNGIHMCFLEFAAAGAADAATDSPAIMGACF